MWSFFLIWAVYGSLYGLAFLFVSMAAPPTGLEWDEGGSPMGSLGDFNQDAEGTKQPSKGAR